MGRPGEEQGGFPPAICHPVRCRRHRGGPARDTRCDGPASGQQAVREGCAARGGGADGGQAPGVGRVGLGAGSYQQARAVVPAVGAGVMKATVS